MEWITVPEKGLSLREVRRLTQRSVNLSAEVEASVSAILKNVQENGDRALRELTEKFDGVRLDSFRVTEEEVQEALQGCGSGDAGYFKRSQGKYYGLS